MNHGGSMAERAGTKEQRRMVDSRGALAQDGRRAERLELRVPTTPTQLPAVRAMAGDLAMRMDYDLDAVEDLRLAVDEACATLAQIAAGDSPLTVVFETTRAGLHIDAWVPTAEGTEVPRDGFGWAVLATLVDAVEGRRSTQTTVPGGDGSDSPVCVISMDKYLPGQHPTEVTAGQSLSVAR
jgi:serine/threonine-protein kinase RsbW